MSTQVYEQRREALRKRMHEAGLAALLVSLDANRYYLSGFELHDPQMNESSGRLLILADGKDLLCTDSRFTTAAEEVWEPDRIFVYRGKSMERINELIARTVSGTVGFEARSLSVEDHEAVSRDLSFKPADGLVESLRMIKDADEIARMERSCALNEQMMQWLPGVLVPGRTEAQIAWDIEQFFRNNGAQELAFASIVAIGGNAALPHALPGSRPLTWNCNILIDVGCRVDGYCSDQTRSFWIGDKPDPDFSYHLDCVRQAQQEAISIIRPGVSGAEVYKAACACLERKGVLDLFTHGLGHGVGLQTHEAPSLSPVSDLVLRPGMVVTVEPGLYVPGSHGVRWEHMILVTEDGARVL